MRAADAQNIDAANFDAEKAFLVYLKNNTVSSLVQKNIDLQNDIKSFDQDIQTLVFENYNKFIASIDTVKKMRTEIQQIDGKMKKLSTSMEKINSSALKIDDTLKLKRTEIQKLDVINKDLQKLRQLCEIPQVAKSELAEYKKKMASASSNVPPNLDKIFAQTISNYENCGHILEKYHNEPLIKPIYLDSLGTLEEIRAILFKLQNLATLEDDQIRIITKKLAIIYTDDSLVLKNYLNIIKERLKRNLKELLDNPKFASDELNKLEEEETNKYLESKNYDIILHDFETFKLGLEKEVCDRDKNTEGSVIWMVQKLCETIIADVKTEFKFLSQDLGEHLSKSPNAASYFEKIDSVQKEMLYTILSKVSEKIAMRKVSNYVISECLKILQKEYDTILVEKKSKIFRTEVYDKFSELVEAIIRAQLMNSFASLKNRFLNYLLDSKLFVLKFEELTDEGDVEYHKKEIFGQLNVFKNKFYASICNNLIELKAFVNAQDSYLSSNVMFISALHGQFVDFISTIIRALYIRDTRYSQEFVSFINPAQQSRGENLVTKDLNSLITKLIESQDSSPFHIFVVHLAKIIEKKYIDRAFEALFEVFHKEYTNLDPITKSEYQSLRVKLENEELGRLNGLMKSEVWRTYGNYAEFYYEQVSKVFKNYFRAANWLTDKDPRDLTAEIEKVCLRLKQIQLELLLLFPDTKRGNLKKESFLKSKPFNLEMERLLSRKSHLFEKVEISKNNVIGMIVKSLFRGFMENTRRFKYTKCGFQQLQIDLYVIAQMAFEMVSPEDEGLIHGFYNEILETASLLCFEPALLDNTIIETIAEHKRGKGKF